MEDRCGIAVGRCGIVVGRCGVVVGRCGVVVDRCRSLWIVVGRCGSFRVLVITELVEAMMVTYKLYIG